MTYKLGGWKLEEYSSEDKIFNVNNNNFAQKLSASNKEVDLRKWCSTVENQSDLGSCVANAVVGGLELLQIRNKQQFKDLSRLFVYYNSRLMTGDSDKDTGTYIRMAMGTLSSIGTCTETKWPYDTSKVFFRPTWGSYREAYTNKIDSYYRIDDVGSSRIQKIKQALESEHPVVFGCKVDSQFSATGYDGVVLMPKNSRMNVGGHAMLIVGYKNDGNTLIVRNSWGTSWGDGGYCYMPSAYLDVADANDFWVPTASPSI